MRRDEGRRGQALLMVTCSLFLIFAMLALEVDLGWAYFRREAAQAAADAASSAVIKAAALSSPSSQACGTNNVWCGTPPGTVTACPATAPSNPVTSFDYGCALAAANGFTTTGSQTVSIQANTTSNAPSVPGTTVAYWATVLISENVTPFFGAPGGGGGLLSSNARSTSGLTSTPGSVSSTCMYILSPHGTNAFNIGNGAAVTTSSCGIQVDSNATTAMQVTGGATVHSSFVKSNGGVSVNNGGCVDTPSGGCNSLTPQTGVSPIADPLLGLPSPTPAGTCNSGNFTSWQATPYKPTAGTYCGFTVGNGMSAVLGPGTYIINGGTFSIQGGSTVTATGGVMIYLTGGATVNIANGTNVTLAAQSSGAYQGVLFYQDRSMTSPGSSTFAGGATMNLSGTLYFPNALLNINNGSSTQTEALVVGSVSFQGGATFKQATNISQTGLGTAPTMNTVVIE